MVLGSGIDCTWTQEDTSVGFESGSISVRAFYLSRTLPDNHVERFADHALPSLQSLSTDSISGWVTGRHLLDRMIDTSSAYYAGYLRLALVRAERKVPAPLLRAECMMEELAQVQAQDGHPLKRDQRSQIRREVSDRLLPQMPPQLRAIPITCGRQDDVLFAAATTDAQCDALMLAFGQAVDIELVPLTPESAALRRRAISIRDLAATSLSPECADEEVSDRPGMDFLTWLWFFSETGGGELSTGQGRFGVAIEGPLTFVMEGSGAHETRLRNGSPLQSTEAQVALLSGKKLARARVMLARDGDQWSAELDAESFVMRGLKLPKSEDLDAASRYQVRMLALRAYFEGLLSFYDAFLEERLDPARWVACVGRMRDWVAGRQGKR